MSNKKYYRVGIILKTQGLKGELKIKPTTDFSIQRFKTGNLLWISDREGFQALVINKSRQNKGFWFIQFADLADINLVEGLVGKDLYVSSDQRDQTLSANEFYVDDLIGLPIFDLADQQIGELKEILSYGPNDVWVVEQRNGKELLLPYIEDFIKKVDIDKQRIIVDLALYNEG